MKRANVTEDGSAKRSATARLRVSSEIRCVGSKEFLASWLRPYLSPPYDAATKSTREIDASIEMLWQHGEPLELLCSRGEGDTYLQVLLARVAGRANEFVLTEHDVTDTQQELEALRDFFDNGSLGLHCVGVDGRILRANQHELEFLGYSAADYVGKSIVDFHADRDTINDILARLLRGERVVDYEARLKHRDGTIRHVLINSSVRFASSGRFLHTRCFTQDITQKKRLEEDLKHAKETADAANQAKDHFLGVLSHELRTPLTSALLLADDYESKITTEISPPVVREDMSIISRQIRLQVQLIDDLLDVTKLQHGKLHLDLRSVDAHTLFRQIEELFTYQIKSKPLKLVQQLLATQCTLLADVTRLQQVCWNLLGNAIKFTPADGTVTVRTWNTPAARTFCMQISDTGIGIEQSALPRIFNVYEQSKHANARSYGGLGLGLSISKTITALHGGTLEVASAGINQGASFTVTLPLHPVDILPVHAASLPASPFLARRTSLPAQARSLRILLVDDDLVTMKVMQRFLGQLGLQVHAASSCEEAVRIASSSGDNSFDVLLCDLSLPDGSGYELLPKLRARHSSMHCIALSGYGREEDLQRSYQAGFVQHLTKPVRTAQVEAAILAVVAEKD